MHQITVRELTELADIHRATFYTHYQDIFELYEKTEEAVLDDITAILRNSPNHNYEVLFAKLLDYILDNKPLSQMLLGDTGNRRFQNKMGRLLENQYIELSLAETSITTAPIEWEYLVSYHIQGCINLISKWVKNGCKSPAKEQLANMILEIDSNFGSVIDSYS